MMNYFDLLKRALKVTWRYRPLWIFGFLLALCGGGRGGGGGNFNLSGGDIDGLSNDLGDLLNLPPIDTSTIIAIIVGLICLALLLGVLGSVVQVVTRTALIGMVRQIQDTGVVTISEGWRLGWSAGAWRLFLIGLLIGLPLAILFIFLLALAFLPLLLLIAEVRALTIIGVLLTVLAVLFVLLILLLISAVISPFRELAWRRTVLETRGVIDSLRDTFGLIKHRLKDVAIVWLLMFGIGLGWGIAALLVILPISLVLALIVGGFPAVLVYLISSSLVGAAVAGIPLALLVLILISTAATGLYLIFQSAVWTLTYLEIRKTAERGYGGEGSRETPAPDLQSPISEPQPGT